MALAVSEMVQPQHCIRLHIDMTHSTWASQHAISTGTGIPACSQEQCIGDQRVHGLQHVQAARWLWAGQRTIMDILCREGWRLKSTRSPFCRCRSTLSPTCPQPGPGSKLGSGLRPERMVLPELPEASIVAVLLSPHMPYGFCTQTS